jgi:DNA-directed RNA polymerase I, II, and III subunit RPABC2
MSDLEVSNDESNSEYDSDSLNEENSNFEDDEETVNEETVNDENDTLLKNKITDINFIDDEDDEDENDENYLKKLDKELRKNYLIDFHPDSLVNNYIEIQTLSQIIRDSDGNIIDDLHKTVPFLTKYEKTRILGQRAKQIESGSKPFVTVQNTIIDSYSIALLELKEKKIPFIIRRPLPNGSSEYWKISDLQLLY